MAFNSSALRAPSSDDTCRLSCRSLLLPTNIIMISLPRSRRTSSIHLVVRSKDFVFVTSYTITATFESLM
ncbi:hypothetical protein FF38_05849 [Lucilia cuprina]|uniref:Uncharacterized protein n=1 Tax=Lucilia cuprina TaxID=7375 RepID=A0A0L0CMI6_LUCCU|nr:hypothetical protein FF38_05849 [Lucilia cuprina]